MRSRAEVERALALMGDGLTASQAARVTGVPRSTIRDWAAGRSLSSHRRGDSSAECGCDHSFAHLDARAYGYLLGMYLGDGCLSRCGRVWRLRVTLDAAYPGIIEECASAVDVVGEGRRVLVLRRRSQRCAEVSAYWKHWPCLIPQHGSGRKHQRPITLTRWQHDLIVADPRPFLRGLIHSDGSRLVATERKGAYVRRAPRYTFRNRSEDILGLFCTACDLAGVHYTRPSSSQIAVYRKDAVATLDEFVGSKR